MNTTHDRLQRFGRTPSTGDVPAIVDAALERCWRDEAHAMAMPYRTDAEQATRAARLAAVADRTARWWAVLARWAYSRAGTVPLVFGQAATVAAARMRDNARFWRETAADWSARAEQRLTSDAAGALCNHHELETAS